MVEIRRALMVLVKALDTEIATRKASEVAIQPRDGANR
jgi:hypothetical protein